ncbi:hypothetical protein WISP_36428 [Willisornis vidua]|uniref:Uncharacterized protein n=1 Tax=Willisornis vidua TaxID=1566151 RepID=A0ABQ9DP53_9PASS|nr:hypothetical protein WISP_36428 [Willisornis vidua]
MHVIILPHVQDFVFLPVELYKAPVGPFLQHVQVPLDNRMTMWPTRQFDVINKFAEGALCPIILTIMKILNRTVTSIDLWGSPLVTGDNLDTALHITTLQAQKFSQFPIHLTVCSSNPYINSFSMKMLQEMVSKASLKSR